MEKLRCWLCGKEVNKNDPMYPHVHYKCSNKLLRKLETLKVIDILSIEGIQIKYKFNDSFEKHLDRTLDHTRHHIITDETVDDDLVTLQGVLRTITSYLSKETPHESIYRCAEFVYNSLMSKKYGRPVPKEKKFGARAKEFFEEVYSIDVTEQVLYQKVFGNRFAKNVKAKRRGKLLPSIMVSKELDEELDRGVSNILEVIEKLAIEMEKKFEVSRKWRHFRMNELLLQTIKNMIVAHLQSETPPTSEINLDQEDIQILKNTLKLMFMDIAEVTSVIAKKNNMPFDVVLAKIISEMIANIVMHYVKLKTKYAEKP